MTGDKVLDLVQLFLLEKLLCICTVGFCDQASPDLYHVDELKNFVSGRNLLEQSLLDACATCVSFDGS